MAFIFEWKFRANDVSKMLTKATASGNAEAVRFTSNLI